MHMQNILLNSTHSISSAGHLKHINSQHNLGYTPRTVVVVVVSAVAKQGNNTQCSPRTAPRLLYRFMKSTFHAQYCYLYYNGVCGAGKAISTQNTVASHTPRTAGQLSHTLTKPQSDSDISRSS